MMLSPQGGVMAEFLRFALRLPLDLHKKLKAMAERESRSLHGQIIYLLRKAAESEGDRK
jgi:hypothetical protein